MSALVLSPLTPPSPLATAPRFGWDLTSRQWTWSPELCGLFGHTPGTVDASTEQMLGQVHRHDLHGWVDAMHAGMQRHRLVVHEHRIVDRAGLTRPVLLLARPASASGGPVSRVDGIVLPLDEEDQSTLDGDVAPELILLVMSVFGLSQAAGRVLIRHCDPVPSEWGRHRLQVVGEDGVAGQPGGSLLEDVTATLFPGTRIATPTC